MQISKKSKIMKKRKMLRKQTKDKDKLKAQFMARDYYEILGLSKSASDSEIKSSYLSLRHI